MRRCRALAAAFDLRSLAVTTLAECPVGFKLAGPYGPLELGAQRGAQNGGSAVGQ